MIARGGWGDRERELTTWYDPHREQEDIDQALWWVLSQPVHTAPSAGDVNLLPKVLEAAERYRRPLTSRSNTGWCRPSARLLPSRNWRSYPRTERGATYFFTRRHWTSPVS